MLDHPKWRAFGEALGTFAQGWADASAAYSLPSPPVNYYVQPVTPPRRPQSTFTTATQIGTYTFLSGSTNGTVNKVGDYRYCQFSDGTHGTSNQIGDYTYYRFNGNGQSLNGTTSRVGDYQYRQFSNGTTGTTTQVGDYTCSSFSNGTHCTTTTVGTYVYTTCN